MFPEYLKNQRRWLVRGKQRIKLPFAAFDIRPDTYVPADDEPADAWRYKWNRPEIWASYEEALTYWQAHSDVGGLTYVVHPGTNSVESQLRVICLDFDKSFKDGKIDETVDRFLLSLSTYVELSQSGRGLHAFVLVECPPFRNVLQSPIGDCKVDILCSSQIAVTGKTISSNWVEVRQVPKEFFDRLNVKRKQERIECPDIWTEQTELDGSKQYLVQEMMKWEPCFRSSKGCTLGAGGDSKFFEAACHLARHGVTGLAAEQLLQCVPQFPPFTEEERRHKVESAYTTVHQTGEYGTHAFPDDIPAIPVPTKAATPRVISARWGFSPIQVDDLIAMDLQVTYLVERLFVDKEPLFFGGVAKSFKTSTAADLAVSLAAGVPFLGRFQILQQRTVAFFTSEIGLAPACQLFTRIAHAKQISVIGSHLGNLDIIDRVPSFRNSAANVKALHGLQAYLKECRVDVAIFDPLYLAMGGVSLSDLNEAGDTLNHIVTICRDLNVWPIFCHHARKTIEQGKPLDITALTGAGIAEYARQWFLISHAAPFERGHASLFVRAGSSAAGDGGIWRLEIEEGVANELLQRKWEVSITEGEEGNLPEVRESILEALSYCGFPESLSTLVDLANGAPRQAVANVLRDLCQEGLVILEKGKYLLKEKIK